MKSETLEPELGEAKLGHRASPLNGLADLKITRVGQLVSLYVEVAIRQTGCGFHVRETDRWARHEGSQDSEAGGGADHFVEVKVHDLSNFIL